MSRAEWKDLAHRKIGQLPNDEYSCVYFVLFTDNINQKKLSYIGMTTKDFKDRFKEQIADIKYNKVLTTLSNLNQK